jgi:phosphoribosylcarboxyaminoimidazole (NCAIR) mutase
MKRKIGIMVGSDTDLPQCLDGLAYLKQAQDHEECEVVVVLTNSIHRNTEEVLENLRRFSHLLDVWIIGAGWANHLTGTCDAFLRYTLKNTKTHVFGVAFEDRKNPDYTMAAILSITRVPGTKVIFNGYQGANGFLRVCQDAVKSTDLQKITINPAKLAVKRTLEQAIEFAAKK